MFFEEKALVFSVARMDLQVFVFLPESHLERYLPGNTDLRYKNLQATQEHLY